MIDKIIEDVGNGIIRVNLDPDRWYEQDGVYYPSVTWILEYYPKDIGFHIWLSKLKDWDEGRRILHAAGDRGSRVHAGIEKLLRRETLHYEDVMPGHTEPFTPEDWTYLLSFMNFYEDYPLTVLNLEETVIYQDDVSYNFGGTVDFRGEIIIPDGIKHNIILDWKTSSAIYPSHYMQISAYAIALDYQYAGIVRLGSRHKRGYQFETLTKEGIDYYYSLFLNVHSIWQDQNQGAEPRWKEFSRELKLEVLDDTQDDQEKDSGGRQGEDQVGDEGEEQIGEGNPKELRLF